MDMAHVEGQRLEYAAQSKDPELKLPAWVQYAILTVILLANVLLKAPNLGHAALKPMDESFHAVVARNLMYDPLKPTLIREPYLPYDPTDWLSNHVWLHKPVLPLWIIAISFKCFGVSALALRLPSLILSTFAVGLTFLIARKLYSPIVGLLASAIQAIVPTIGMIVHGYVFSDAVDINLLLWSELSLFLMLQKGKKWIWLSGAAAGAAFMSKTFPAMFVLVPLTLLVGSRQWAAGRKEGIAGGRLGSSCPPPAAPGSVLSFRPPPAARRPLYFLLAFMLVAAPWNIYCAIRFPTEFKAEYGLILTHLSGDVENWASPWDRVWFQHLPSALYLFWTLSLIGTIVLTIRAIQLKKWEWLFAPIWAAAVLIPFTLVTSKTPSATLPAWPALMIGAGFLIWRACQGYIVEASTTVTLLIAMIFFRGDFIQKGWGATAPFEIMNQASWILWHLLAGLVVLGISLAFDKRLIRHWTFLTTFAVAIGLAYLTILTGKLSLRVQTLDKNLPMLADTGRWIDRNLPRDAVIVFGHLGVKFQRQEHALAFYADRTVIPPGRTLAYPSEKRIYWVGEKYPPGQTLYNSPIDHLWVSDFRQLRPMKLMK